jgi:hypothetical protein
MKRAACSPPFSNTKKKTLKSVSFISILFPILSIYFENISSYQFHLNCFYTHVKDGYPVVGRVKSVWPGVDTSNTKSTNCSLTAPCNMERASDRVAAHPELN